MKKHLVLISAVLLLAGCAAPPSASPSPTSPAVTAAPTAESAAEPTAAPENVNTEKELASFSTKIYDKHKNRINNLELAAKAVNGKVIAPGETFSFNGTVGRRTEEKGYKKAQILVGKKHVQGLGGGVCQVSTTIYNAAEKAGMQIVERHKHDIEVVYAKNGTDATVSYGDKDMKFKNTKDYSVKIEASVSDGQVFARILAQ